MGFPNERRLNPSPGCQGATQCRSDDRFSTLAIRENMGEEGITPSALLNKTLSRRATHCCGAIDVMAPYDAQDDAEKARLEERYKPVMDLRSTFHQRTFEKAASRTETFVDEGNEFTDSRSRIPRLEGSHMTTPFQTSRSSRGGCGSGTRETAGGYIGKSGGSISWTTGCATHEPALEMRKRL